MLAILATAIALSAPAPCVAPAEDSVFWNPKACGDGHGCILAPVWPSYTEKTIAFCRSQPSDAGKV